MKQKRAGAPRQGLHPNITAWHVRVASPADQPLLPQCISGGCLRGAGVLATALRDTQQQRQQRQQHSRAKRAGFAARHKEKSAHTRDVERIDGQACKLFYTTNLVLTYKFGHVTGF
eukprot:364500-Chlamydomonas_euryale.AAC.28